MNSQQRKLKTLQSWSSTFMNQEIGDRVASWKTPNDFELLLFFDDVDSNYQSYFDAKANDNNAAELMTVLSDHKQNLYGYNSTFVDLGKYNFNYSDLLDFLKLWKNAKFFKNNGLTIDVSEHANHLTEQQYIKLHIHKVKKG
jgi:hypothetical protein